MGFTCLQGNKKAIVIACFNPIVDDLSPEDLAELERLGGIMIELQIMKRNNDPGYSKDKYVEIATQLSELDRKFIEKYGR